MRSALLIASLFVAAGLLTGCEGSKDQQVQQPYVNLPKDMDTSLNVPAAPAKPANGGEPAAASSAVVATPNSNAAAK